MQALQLAEGLASGALLRMRFPFDTDPAVTAIARTHPLSSGVPGKVSEAGGLPVFTLRRPMKVAMHSISFRARYLPVCPW